MISSGSISPSLIDVQEVGSIRPKSKIAFCFNSSSWTLLVSNSGHNAILRGRDRRDYDYGGWCDLRTGRLWPTNGTVSNVPENWRESIQGALENKFRAFLEWRD
jgi:hypothetical protein